jgi:hypothetical protein
MPIMDAGGPNRLLGWFLLAMISSTTTRAPGATPGDVAQSRSRNTPTFTKNVAPILFKNCVHR